MDMMSANLVFRFPHEQLAYVNDFATIDVSRRFYRLNAVLDRKRSLYSNPNVEYWLRL